MALWLAGSCGERKDRWIMSGDSWYRKAVRSTTNELQNFGSFKGTDIASQAVPVLAVLPSSGQTPYHSSSVLFFLCLCSTWLVLLCGLEEKKVCILRKREIPTFLSEFWPFLLSWGVVGRLNLETTTPKNLRCVAYLNTFCIASIYPPLRNLPCHW